MQPMSRPAAKACKIFSEMMANSPKFASPFRPKPNQRIKQRIHGILDVPFGRHETSNSSRGSGTATVWING
jgi:hypothetical protein